MVLGLCSSFAVLPAFSLVKAGSGPRLAGSARPLGDGADALNSEAGGGSSGLAALLVADAALAVATRPGPAGAPVSAGAGAPGSFAAHAAPRPAATPPAGPTAPAAAAAPASGALALAPVGKAAPAPAPRSSPAGRATQGVASWLDISAGTCANNDAPMGAVITVTSAAGISITCTVVSRGPFVAGRVVDLARSSFALLGPVSKGLVSVSVTW